MGGREPKQTPSLPHAPKSALKNRGKCHGWQVKRHLGFVQKWESKPKCSVKPEVFDSHKSQGVCGRRATFQSKSNVCFISVRLYQSGSGYSAREGHEEPLCRGPGRWRTGQTEADAPLCYRSSLTTNAASAVSCTRNTGRSAASSSKQRCTPGHQRE